MTVAKVAEAPEIFLGKYRSFRLLGEGGMGQVYYGQNLANGQEVVIKVMHDHLAEIPAIRQSFQSELQLMMQFQHPYSVRLIDGSLGGPGRPCLVMEYIDGVSLEGHADKHGRFPALQVGRWLAQLCQVLHAAHHSNILHRDLTLNNLMLTRVGHDETIKVMDFGLARLTTAYFIPFERLTGSGTHLGGGTPDYVSPEQARGEEIDQRADLYSVGVGLYRLLCGALPFQEFTDTHQIIDAHLNRQAPTFAQRGVTDVSPRVEAIVRQLMSKVPAERPGSAKELALRFQDALHTDLLPPGAFDVKAIKTQAAPLPYREEYCLDRMDAWMPESVAIMKLRGFVESINGEIAESHPGRIRVRIQDPRQPAEPSPTKSGLFSMFRRNALPAPAHYLHIDLYMQKRDHGTRSMVEIAVVMEPEMLDNREQAAMREGFGQRICRELRAYLHDRPLTCCGDTFSNVSESGFSAAPIQSDTLGNVSELGFSAGPTR